MPLSLGVIYPPHQAESVQQWLSLLDGILGDWLVLRLTREPPYIAHRAAS